MITFSDEEVINVAHRVAGRFASGKPWLVLDDVKQEAVCRALEEIPKMNQERLAHAETPLGILGWLVNRRLIDWQRQEKALYSGRQGRDSTIRVIRNEYVEEYDEDNSRVPNAIGVPEMGYWLVEEMSAIKDTLAERAATKAQTTNKYNANVGDPLSDRQTEVLVLFAQGKGSPAVAEAMGVSIETIKTNLKNIRWKLQAKNTTHAVAIAWRAGIIT